MNNNTGTWYFWVAALAVLITAAVFAERSVTLDRGLITEQKQLLRKNEELSREMRRLRNELADAQGEASAYKKLYAHAVSAR